VVGGEVCINGGHSSARATVQIAGEAKRLSAQHLVKGYQTHAVLRDLINGQVMLLMFQAQQNGACHAMHSIDARLCRWMLQAQDVLGTDTIDLTQEFLSHMLGVQRTSVSISAHRMQEAGFIRYSRGRIIVVNRDGLEECACECYAEIRKRTDRLIPAIHSAAAARTSC